MSGNNFFKVNFIVGGKKHEVMMEKGVAFRNGDREYAVDVFGNLRTRRIDIFSDDVGAWNMASGNTCHISEDYWQLYKNVLDNDGDVSTFSKADIEELTKLYNQGKLTVDLSKDLPAGYKIEKVNAEQKGIEFEGKFDTYRVRFDFQVKDFEEFNSIEQVKSDFPPEALIGADSELVKEYAAKFKDMDPEEIANCLLEQISGPSMAENTLSMYDAIPIEKLRHVLNIYQSKTETVRGETRQELTSGTYYGYETGGGSSSYKAHYEVKKSESLYRAMRNEFGISAEELVPRIARYVDFNRKIGLGKDHGYILRQLEDYKKPLGTSFDQIMEDLFNGRFIGARDGKQDRHLHDEY